MQKQVEVEGEREVRAEVLEQDQKVEELQQRPRSRRLDGITIFCPLCKDYLAHSVTTTCQHTFCEMCLSEYLLYLDECPECCAKIRNQKQANNILLDNLILDYIKKFDSTEVGEYDRRLEVYKEYKRARTYFCCDLGLVDVRDLDFVWCTGKVHRTVNKYQEKKVKYVVIKYDRSTKKQEMPESSQRLAPRGFFTSREDIPKYDKGKLVLRCPEEGISYQLVQESESEEEEEKREC